MKHVNWHNQATADWSTIVNQGVLTQLGPRTAASFVSEPRPSRPGQRHGYWKADLEPEQWIQGDDELRSPMLREPPDLGSSLPRECYSLKVNRRRMAFHPALIPPSNTDTIELWRHQHRPLPAQGGVRVSLIRWIVHEPSRSGWCADDPDSLYCSRTALNPSRPAAETTTPRMLLLG